MLKSSYPANNHNTQRRDHPNPNTMRVPRNILAEEVEVSASQDKSSIH